jgi:hypothetical protein
MLSLTLEEENMIRIARGGISKPHTLKSRMEEARNYRINHLLQQGWREIQKEEYDTFFEF